MLKNCTDYLGIALRSWGWLTKMWTKKNWVRRVVRWKQVVMRGIVGEQIVQRWNPLWGRRLRCKLVIHTKNVQVKINYEQLPWMARFHEINLSNKQMTKLYIVHNWLMTWDVYNRHSLNQVVQLWGTKSTA